MKKEELYDIAILSKLKIKEEEVEEMLEEMEKIIAFANKIDSAKITDEDLCELDEAENVFRKDEVEKSYDRDEILKNTKTKEDGFFYLKNAENFGGEEN